MRLNAKDAEARGIKDGDLSGRSTTAAPSSWLPRSRNGCAPGTVHSYESCADYIPLGEPGESPDIAGCVNILTNKRFITPTSTAMSNNSCLVQVEKWEGEAR